MKHFCLLCSWDRGAYLLVRLLAGTLSGLFKLLKLAGYLFLTVVVIYMFVDPGRVAGVLLLLIELAGF